MHVNLLVLKDTYDFKKGEVLFAMSTETPDVYLIYEKNNNRVCRWSNDFRDYFKEIDYIKVVTYKPTDEKFYVMCETGKRCFGYFILNKDKDSGENREYKYIKKGYFEEIKESQGKDCNLCGTQQPCDGCDEEAAYQPICPECSDLIHDNEPIEDKKDTDAIRKNLEQDYGEPGDLLRDLVSFIDEEEAKDSNGCEDFGKKKNKIEKLDNKYICENITYKNIGIHKNIDKMWDRINEIIEKLNNA